MDGRWIRREADGAFSVRQAVQEGNDAEATAMLNAGIKYAALVGRPGPPENPDGSVGGEQGAAALNRWWKTLCDFADAHPSEGRHQEWW